VSASCCTHCRHSGVHPTALNMPCLPPICTSKQSKASDTHYSSTQKTGKTAMAEKNETKPKGRPHSTLAPNNIHHLALNTAQVVTATSTYTTITKRKQCHKQPKTVVRNLRPREKTQDRHRLTISLPARLDDNGCYHAPWWVCVCACVCLCVLDAWCLQVELPTVLELESRPLGAAWHRR
jgi:hypothetical protein